MFELTAGWPNSPGTSTFSLTGDPDVQEQRRRKRSPLGRISRTGKFSLLGEIPRENQGRPNLTVFLRRLPANATFLQRLQSACAGLWARAGLAQWADATSSAVGVGAR
ncbi:Hypothetical protein NTJ_12050 [Nesidiocoris tenuis]|uniref:Uncharacterized protein n=1 Tax=Nesidiocoris tenuis TaxID=355587 RepID=A0ABN7B4Q6_9HEMI|nr:Hypothetical protein NTJ_12050 [Nesidiocoris tenuis]